MTLKDDIPQDEAAKFLASIAAADSAPLKPHMVTLATEYASRLTPACIQPWELLQFASVDVLPPARREHVAACFDCSLVFKYDAGIAAHVAEAAALAASLEPDVVPAPIREPQPRPERRKRTSFREKLATLWKRLTHLVPRRRKPSAQPTVPIATRH